jgi:hypothetical protein
MRIAWAMFCRYAENEGGGCTIIGGGLDTFTLPEFPGSVAIFLATRILAMEDELEAPFNVTFHIRNPQLEQVGEDLTFPITPQLNPERTPGWEQGIVLTGQHVFQVHETGPHQLDILLDGAHGSTIPFLVNQVEAEDAA